MKKLILLLLCLLTALPFSGCTTQPAQQTAAPTQTLLVTTVPTVPETVPEETVPEETEPEPQFTQLDHDQVQATIEEIAKKYHAVGLQVAIVENGSVVGSYAYGWATKTYDPMTTDHKIRTASLSKVVVGLTSVLMHEDGILDLKGDMSDYWGVPVRNPMFPDYTINIWDILSHTSSIASYEEVSMDYRHVLERMEYGFWSVEPGVMESRCYNNYAFGVLGMTLELAADKPLNTYLDEKLFTAMDIDGAFAAGSVKNTELVATLYDGSLPCRYVYKQLQLQASETPGGNGGYYCGDFTVSAEDLAKLVALMANDGVYEGQQLMQPETVQLMEQLMDPIRPNGTYQAHPTLYVPGLYGREGIHFHTGTGYGVFNTLSYDPVTGDGVVVLSTGAAGYMSDYEISRLSDEINIYIYDLLK